MVSDLAAMSCKALGKPVFPTDYGDWVGMVPLANV
jgi:hypothetical protein